MSTNREEKSHGRVQGALVLEVRETRSHWQHTQGRSSQGGRRKGRAVPEPRKGRVSRSRT